MQCYLLQFRHADYIDVMIIAAAVLVAFLSGASIAAEVFIHGRFSITQKTYLPLSQTLRLKTVPKILHRKF